MKLNYILVVVVVLFCLVTTSIFAQSSGPEFLSCSDEPISLCVQDEGVSIPSTNQLFKGDLNPDASRCSVHLSRSNQVKSNCGSTLEYEVRWYENDTSQGIVLQTPVLISADSSGVAALYFDTENAEDILISRHGLSYTEGCSDVHRIEWIVRDSCGHEERCTQFFNLYDCAPVAVHPDPARLKILPFDYSSIISIKASDFILSTLDDCSRRGEMMYSFSEIKFSPDTIISCDSIDGFGVALPLPIWIAGNGVDSNCDGVLSWEERVKDEIIYTVVYTDPTGSLHCGYPDPMTVSGNVFTDEKLPISDVSVVGTMTGQIFPTFITSLNGNYWFQSHYFPNPLTITPSRNDHHRNGVSTLDGVKIKKHLLGQETITNPYLLIAADINNSQWVSAIDLVELRKLILGIYEELPSQPSWRFVSESFVFIDSLYPWPFEESLTITVTESVSRVNFIGIKIGDLNHTAITNAASMDSRSVSPRVTLRTSQQEFSPGEIIRIPLYIDGLSDVLGMQMTFEGDGLDFLGMTSDLIPVTDEDYGLFGDAMTMSWFDIEATSVSRAQPLFTLHARANQIGNLKDNFSITSSITEAELYSSNEEIYAPVLWVRSEPHPSLSVFPVQPNPWKEQAVIGFTLSEDAEVRCSFFNTAGQRVHSIERECRAGYNKLLLSSDDFPGAGLYFFNLNTDTVSASGTFIHLH